MHEKIKPNVRHVASWEESQGHFQSIFWPDPMEMELTQEDCCCSVVTLGCVCTNSGWSIRVLLLNHSHDSAFPLWLLSSCPLPASTSWPYSLTDDLCTDQEEEEYSSSILSIIPTGLIPGNLRGADALSWSKQLYPRVACFSKDCDPGSFSRREQWWGRLMGHETSVV